MTVIQNTLRNNIEFLELSNRGTNVSHLIEITKKIIYVAKIVGIVIGSMSLSFYLTFIR